MGAGSDASSEDPNTDAGPSKDTLARKGVEEKVPDCKDGKVLPPIWLTRVPFWAALCVHGRPKKPVKVDIGTNLIAFNDSKTGESVVQYQVYYSLSKVEIPAGEKQVVWAMCGGAGDWMWNGTRVVPGPRLPADKAKILAEQVDALVNMTRDLDMFRQMLRQAPSTVGQSLRKKVSILDEAITDSAGLLRDSVINENRGILKSKRLIVAPLWNSR